MLKLSVIVVITMTLTSCCFGSTKQSNENSEKLKQSIEVNVPVKIPDTKEIVNTLCSDEFQGRLVGTKGNEKAAEYISKTFKDIGLTPMFKESYYESYMEEVYKKRGLHGEIAEGDKPEKKTINNVVGVIKGKDSKNAVVLSAHFDHIGTVDGKIIRGALDNASGMSALIKISNTLKEKSKANPFYMDVIICAFNGEETGLSGSREFVRSIKSKSLYDNLYNINIDSICAKQGGKLALKNKSKVSMKLYDAVKNVMTKNNIEFADTLVKGTGDHKSFEQENIPNIFIVQENIEKLVHKTTDVPDILDYEKIDNIANAISDFVEINNGVIFQTN